MEGDKAAAGAMTPSGPGLDRLREQYGCGPVRLAGTEAALYERHLLLDNVVDPAAAGPREWYEAVARSVRDVLSQRWVRTEQTYERQNPKRVHSGRATCAVLESRAPSERRLARQVSQRTLPLRWADLHRGAAAGRPPPAGDGDQR